MGGQLLGARAAAAGDAVRHPRSEWRDGQARAQGRRVDLLRRRHERRRAARGRSRTREGSGRGAERSLRRGTRADRRSAPINAVGPHHPAHALQVGGRDGHAPGRDRRRGRGDGGVARGGGADDRAARRPRQRDRRPARQLPARVDGHANRARTRAAAREPAERHQQDADCDACARRRWTGRLDGRSRK